MIISGGNGIGNVVWNKLYRAELFDQIRFPESRNYEDIATTYKVLGKANRLVGVSQQLVHYRERKRSIDHSRSLRNLTDYWTSHHEKYKALIDRYDDCGVELVSSCMNAVGRFWRWYYGTGENDPELVSEMQAFAREHELEILRDKRYSFLIRITCLSARFSSPFVFWLLYRLTWAIQSLIRLQLYEL